MAPKIIARIPPDLVDDQVLRYREVEAITGSSKDSIRRAAARNELKLTRLGPRQVGVRRSELRKWLDQRTA
jgi:excisionase family DNA binding protein